MAFIKITSKTTCDCLSGAVENIFDTFIRKVKHSSNLSNSDFRNYIERGRIAKNDNDCDEVCNLNGVSFEIWNDESKDLLMKKYKLTLTISPKIKNNLCVIKFLPESGVLKHTPNQEEYNEFHYDFHKCDTFSTSDLQLINMIPLTLINV